MGFPKGSLGSKESSCDAGATGDMDAISGPGRSFGGGHGSPLQYSYLKNPMDRGAWQATVHRVAKSWTQLKWLNMQWEISEKSASAYNLSEAWHEVSKQYKNQSL